MIHVDTSVLIGSLTGRRTAAPVLRAFIADGMRVGVCTLVLYEWWRGPRSEVELMHQETLFPRASAFVFGLQEAAVAADICRRLGNPPHRGIDLAIAACAIVQGAAVWTLNPDDFRDIPGLELAVAP
jgi:predicted nucleic acid-binding protein